MGELMKGDGAMNTGTSFFKQMTELINNPEKIQDHWPVVQEMADRGMLPKDLSDGMKKTTKQEKELEETLVKQTKQLIEVTANTRRIRDLIKQSRELNLPVDVEMPVVFYEMRSHIRNLKAQLDKVPLGNSEASKAFQVAYDEMEAVFQELNAHDEL